MSNPTISSSPEVKSNTLNQNNQDYSTGTQQQRETSITGNNRAASTASLLSSNLVNVTSDQRTYNTSWYNKDWNYRQNITILPNEFTANETNFPMLLDFYDTNLKLALNSGYDILFTDTANNKLPYERITFDRNYNSTDAHLRVWVKGNWSTKGNTIFMYFGNPFSPDQQNSAGTWSNGYEAVYHLNSVGSVIVDSTGKHNGTTTLTSSTSQPGVIGNGVYFNGIDGDIVLNNINSNSWNQITLEAWITFGGTKITGTILTKQSSSSTIWNLNSKVSRFGSEYSTDGTGAQSNLAQVNFGPQITVNSWYSFAMVWNSSIYSTNNLKYYLNGTLATGSFTLNGTSLLDSSALASIGGAPDGSALYTGMIDEVRISSIYRTQNWLLDSRTNELNPNLFFTINSSLEKLVLPGNWSFNQLKCFIIILYRLL